MDAKTHPPMEFRRERPDGIEVADTQNITYSDAEFGVQRLIADGFRLMVQIAISYLRLK